MNGLKNDLINAVSSIDDKTLLEQKISFLCTQAAKDINDLVASHSEKYLSALTTNDYQCYPDGTKFLIKNGDFVFLVVEHTPKVRTLTVDMSYHSHGIGSHRYGTQHHGIQKLEKVRVSLPYMIYAINLIKLKNLFSVRSLSIAFRKSPIKNFDDDLFSCILPNTNENGFICGGFNYEQYPSVIEAFNATIGHYWQSLFRYSIHHNIPNDLTNWNEWEEKTKENPLFVLQTDWIKMSQKLHSFVLKDVTTIDLLSEDIIKKVKSIIL